MVKSNSKLTTQEKLDLVEFKVNSKGSGFYYFPDTGLTVLTMPGGMGWQKVSVSFCSANEKRFRESVGAYHAASRMDVGQFIRVPSVGFNADDFVQVLNLPFVSRETNELDFPNLKKLVQSIDATEWPSIKKELKNAAKDPFIGDVSKNAYEFASVFTWARSPQRHNYWRDLDKKYSPE